MPQCRASVDLLLASAAMQPLIGTSLHAALRKRVLSAAARVPEPAPAKPLEDELKAEVVRLLAAKRATAPDEPTALQYISPVKRQRTETTARREAKATRTHKTLLSVVRDSETARERGVSLDPATASR